VARWLCALSDADIDARPWTALEAELQNVRGLSLRGEHVQVRVGTVPRDIRG
jgi:demethylmenaquinone methyltransferase/2-methoxy-6-polyprenyl-1,4-benzoquinol methylase